MAAAACGARGGGYVPLHVGAAVERRDEAEEVERFPSAGAAEFPGIVEDESRGGFGHQTRWWQAASPIAIASAQARRFGWLRIRPEDTGAGS